MREEKRIVVAGEAGIAIRTPREVTDAIGAGLGKAGLLLTEANLGSDFFDLRTGLAGELAPDVAEQFMEWFFDQ